MAVDFGDARTGVAVSDETLTLTGCAWVIQSRRPEEVAGLVFSEAKSRSVSCIVVGYPKNMDGSVGVRAEKSEAFAMMLKALVFDGADAAGGLEGAGADVAAGGGSKGAGAASIEVKLWDERLTTAGANRVLKDVGKFGKKRKYTVDAVAASLILEGYLGSLR